MPDAVASNPFAGLPLQIAAENGQSVLAALRRHDFYPLQLNDLRELRGFSDSQQLRLLEYCLLEEAVRLLQDGQGGRPVASERLPLRSLSDEWLRIVRCFQNECSSWISYVELWGSNWTEEQVSQIPDEGILAGSGWLFTKHISGMHWTEELLDEWASAWDPELVGQIRHDARDPSLVLTHKETGLKILLSADVDFVMKIVRGSLAEFHRSGSGRDSLRAPFTASDFTHSPDYRSITWLGMHYSLTTNQAVIVQVLDEAFIDGNPEISVEHILTRMGTPNSVLRDSFRRSNKDLWGTLITPGTRRGTMRLNISPADSRSIV